MKKSLLLFFTMVLLEVNSFAQKDTIIHSANTKQKRLTHSIGATNAVHYGLLRESNNQNHLKRQDNNTNWTFKLFYELKYKNKLALEMGLSYLANSKSNYTGHIDTVKREIDFELMRVFPQVFVNAKYYPFKKIKGGFFGIGYTRIKAAYTNVAKNVLPSGSDTHSNWQYSKSAISNIMILYAGKEFAYKRIRGDIRLSYYQHIRYKQSNYFDSPPSIMFTNYNFQNIESNYWYNALELGVTFIFN